MATRITTKHVETLKHDEAKRKNIPFAEQQSYVQQEQTSPKQIRYPRNTDLDLQLVWCGKDEQDWSELVVNAPPLYIQKKVHPKVLIDDLLRETKERELDAGQSTPDLFANFNGIALGADKTEFYQHDQNWTNRMILGDSLQVMASLAEREGSTLWLSQKQLTELFGKAKGTISEHVKHIFEDAELEQDSVVRLFRTTAADGKQYEVAHYNLDMALAAALQADSDMLYSKDLQFNHPAWRSTPGSHPA
jgi:adenine-specific DNA-methyltransferase